MNDGLNLYRNSDKVASIHGYMYPNKSNLPETFFIKGADCLGWGTWSRAWKLFEKDSNKLYDRLIHSKQMDEFNFNGAAFKGQEF
jgi:S-formylglutathione hydrolase FrmB